MDLQEIVDQLLSDAFLWKHEGTEYHTGLADGLEEAAKLIKDYLRTSRENNPSTEEAKPIVWKDGIWTKEK